MKRKLSILCMLFVMALGLPMVANAGETPTVTFDGSKEIKYNYEDTTNFGDGFVDMMPGEERSQEIILQNTSTVDVDFFMRTETIKTFEEVNKTSGAAYEILLTVTEGNETRVIYGGTEEDGSNRIGADDEGLGNLNGNVNEWLKVCDLNAGEKATITLKVTLDGESHTNSYMAAEGTFQFEFQAGYTEPWIIYDYVEAEDTVISQVVYTNGVKTGDSANPYLLIGGIGACAVLLIVLVVWKRKSKEETV